MTRYGPPETKERVKHVTLNVVSTVTSKFQCDAFHAIVAWIYEDWRFTNHMIHPIIFFFLRRGINHWNSWSYVFLLPHIYCCVCYFLYFKHKVWKPVHSCRQWNLLFSAVSIAAKLAFISYPSSLEQRLRQQPIKILLVSIRSILLF